MWRMTMKKKCKGKWKLCQNVEDVGHRVVYVNDECPRAIENDYGDYGVFKSWCDDCPSIKLKEVEADDEED